MPMHSHRRDGVQASKPPVRLLGEYTGFNYGLRELGVPWLQHGLGYEGAKIPYAPVPSAHDHQPNSVLQNSRASRGFGGFSRKKRR